MAITETGPSTSAARTYICYPLLPPTEGTSSASHGRKKTTTDNFLVLRLILVDSTRAGKRLPDALSKTVPIWCAVVNRAARKRGLAEVPSPSSPPSSSSDITAAAVAEDLDLDFDLRTPPGAVSPHEHAQIAARLDGWATALAVSCVPPVLTLLHPCSPGARAHAYTHTYRTRRMHCLSWPGRCARCGSRLRRRAFRMSRWTHRRSCLSYA